MQLGFPDSSVGKESACLQRRRPQFHSWVGKIHWRRNKLPTPAFLGFPVAQLVKDLPAMQKTWVQSLGWEDPLKKRKATHSSILAWRIQPVWSQRDRHNWGTFTFTLCNWKLVVFFQCFKMSWHFSEASIFSFLIFIGVQLLYNIMLISAVQQSDPVVHVHTSTPF